MVVIWTEVLAAGGIGLLLGSFLNVVIYRLPKMLEQQWAAEYAHAANPSTAPAAPRFDLMVPASNCRTCGHAIRWYENIPVLSFLMLRGRCSACSATISWRYPVIEVVTATLVAGCAARWGLSTTGLAWAGFSMALLVLALIDWDTTLLPDDITLPLLWAGLVAAALGWTGVPLSTSLWGAVAGYLSLWTVYHGFRLVTGKEGMGYGDFKLFAALGAWFGWPALLPIIVLSSVIGAVVGVALKFTSGLREGGYVPFGPFLAGAGFLTLALGSGRLQQWFGL